MNICGSENGGSIAALLQSNSLHAIQVISALYGTNLNQCVQRVGSKRTDRMVFGFLRRIKSWIVWSWTYLWAFWFLLVLFVVYYLRGPLKIIENIGMGNGCTFLWQNEQVLTLVTQCQIN